MPRHILPMLLFLAACSAPKTEENTESTSTGVTSTDNLVLDELVKFDSEEELIQVFGDSNITREKRYCPEGMCEYQATILYAGKPNEVEFMWEDSANYRDLSQVEVYGKGDWTTSYGIGLGTTLKELEKMNGRPFSFSGFGWDYGGIARWEDGYLDTLKGVFIVLTTPDDIIHPEIDSLIGDAVNPRSNDRIPQEINPIVHSITLIRQRPGE